MTFNVIDIEKPSSVSFQHMYIIKYQLKFENKIFELNQTKLHVSLKYPIHFRYRKPHNDLKYKKAFINRRPEFYFDCLNLNYYNNNTFQTPNDILVNGKISKVMARVSSIAVKKKENFDNLVVFVPTGNLEDLPLVLMVTLIITTGAAVYISKKILGMNKKETVKKQI